MPPPPYGYWLKGLPSSIFSYKLSLFIIVLLRLLRLVIRSSFKGNALLIVFNWFLRGIVFRFTVQHNFHDTCTYSSGYASNIQTTITCSSLAPFESGICNYPWIFLPHLIQRYFMWILLSIRSPMLLPALRCRPKIPAVSR